MATNLLDDDGSASMATMIMTSHHAFRRDIACFARALPDPTRTEVLREEWARFRGALHAHHTIEDTGLFPDLLAKQPHLAAAVATLDGHHRAIDPLLEKGDVAFADLSDRRAAREVVDALHRLLREHLDAEEQTITPYLRTAKEFPALPPEALASYADGFAWSGAGIAPHVLERVYAMLPAGILAHLPAARAAFDERSMRVWGFTHAGATTTSEPAPQSAAKQ